MWGYRVEGACHVEGYLFGVHVVGVAWSKRFSTGYVFAQGPVPRVLHEVQLLASPCLSVPGSV